jgi:hypothetical protein
MERFSSLWSYIQASTGLMSIGSTGTAPVAARPQQASAAALQTVFYLMLHKVFGTSITHVFEKWYQDPKRPIPWAIGGPQPVVVDAAKQGILSGKACLLTLMLAASSPFQGHSLQA